LHELPDFEVHTPSTLGEALTYLAGEGKGSMLLAGGTSLIPRMRRRGIGVKRVVDLSGLRDLRYIRRTQKTIRIGGLTTISELVTADILDDRYRCFKRLGRQFGVEATRNMATVGGNLAVGPEGDLVEILHALDGRVIIRSARGERIAEPTNLGLAEDEVIVEVQFPELEGLVSTWFNKFDRRRENGMGIITTTILVKLRDDRTVEDVRIVVHRARGREIGRARGAESQLREKVADSDTIGRALDTLESEIEPEGDFRGSSRFRKEVTKAMVKEGLAKCLETLTDGRETAGVESR
jgi:CO/xanthine dehydrogenase FAD-binding subunit